MSYTTKSVVTASAGQRDFDIPFPYLDAAHIKVKVAGNPAYWSLVNSGRLRLDFAANAGDLVEISRQTAIDQALVQFNNGAVLTSEDLNKAVQQTLFIQQELTDLYNASLNAALIRIASAGGVIVTDPNTVLDTLSQQLLNTSALASFNARVADITANSNSIINQQTQITGLKATVDALASFNGTGLQTLINNEQTQRIAGDTALTQTIALIGAKSGDGSAIILNQNTCKVSSTQSLADYISGVAAQIGNVQALIQNETTARATADSAFATQFALLGAKSANGQAWVLDESRVMVTGGTVSLGNKLSGLQASIDAANATIATEQTTRANADSAFATQLSNLQATVNSNTATIAAEATARANADSALAQTVNTLQTTVNGNTATISTIQSTVNGLNARYSVAVDVNGNVAGFLLNSNGTTSNFNIVANVFSIIDPANPNNRIVPFEVSGGIVKIKDAAIQNLSIGSLGSGTYNGSMNMGTGRITFNNGSVMKVMGVGFGTNNQFIEWYGPSLPSIGQCSETNAISYLRVDGAAYFGGSLSAGTLTTKAATSDTSAGAIAETQVFGSAGRTITVTFAYSYTSTATGYYSADSTGLSQFNSQKSALGLVQGSDGRWTKNGSNGQLTWVDLYRSVAGGAYTLVASMPLYDSTSIVGTAPIPGDSTGTIVYTDTIGGSMTYTDPQQVAQNRQYKAVLRTRSPTYIDTVTQRLSVICVEQ